LPEGQLIVGMFKLGTGGRLNFDVILSIVN